MPTEIRRPGAPLAGVVACLWHSDPYHPAPTRSRERVLPTGTIDLIANLGDDQITVLGVDPLPGIVVSGAHRRSFVVGAPQRTAVMGVQLRPGGAAPFLPAGELADRFAPLEAFWGRAARSLRQRLAETPDVAGRFAVLEAFLVAQASGPLVLHRTVQAAVRAFEEPSLASVAEVSRRTGLPAKRLLALFREQVGMGPKAYWRVRRFQAALRRLDGGARPAALAADLGYCDQAHFNRDFRLFTGLAPGDYLARPPTRPNHVAL